jgi:hypothetical protein
MSKKKKKFYKAPEKYDLDSEDQVIFLAGAIDMGEAEDWQTKVTADLMSDTDCYILNPRRDDWDDTWEQSKNNAQFYEQVTWELAGMERANVIAMYLGEKSKAPISLLELGLHAQDDKVIVFCHDKFYRKGNIDVVCQRYGIPVFEEMDAWLVAIKNKLKGQ